MAEKDLLVPGLFLLVLARESALCPPLYTL